MQNKELIERALERYLENAAQKRDDARHGGRMDGDGGASLMEERARAYRAGVMGLNPPFLTEKDFREVQKETDPEFETYKRLQEKFG